MSRLIAEKNIDKDGLPDLIYTMAYNIETALMEGGAVSGKDYTLLDLYKMAEPYALHEFKNRKNLYFEIPEASH